MCKRLGLFTVIVVLMFSAIPLTMAESNCDFSYSNQARGEYFFSEQNYSGALYHFICALEQDPHNQALLQMISNIYRYRGDRTNAEHYYKLANESTLSNTTCDTSISQFAHGAQLYAQGERRHALEAYHCVLLQDPDNTMHMMQLVMIYIELEEYDQALMYLDRAIQIDKTDAVVYSRRGYVHYLMGNINQALSDIDTALQLEPTLYSALETRALISSQQETVTSEFCDSTHAHLIRGWEYYAMGDLGHAREAYRCGLDEEPDNILYMMELVLVSLDLVDYDQAMLYLNRAVQTQDDDPVVYSRRGYVHYLMGNLNESLIDLNVALELNPTLGSALEIRALVLAALGQVETVSVTSPVGKNPLPQLDSDLSDISVSMTVAEAAPNSSTADVLRQAAENFFNNYEFERAITQYQTLLAFEPDNAYAHYRIGYAYYALENPAQGLVYLKQAETLNPDHLYTQYFLAMSYSMLGMNQDALTTMSNIYEVYPYDGAFPIAMGHVYRNLGHDESAAAEFNLWLEQHQLLRLDTTPVSNNTPLTLVMDYGVVYDMPFYAIEGNSVRITAESSILNRTPVDPLIVVLDTDGIPIAGDDDSGEFFDAQLTFIPPSTGHYTLLVSHAGGNSAGELNVTVSGIAQSAEMYRTLAQAAMNDGHYHQALDMLDQAIALDGGIYQDYRMQARAYFQLDDYPNTIDAYYRAVELTSAPATIYAEIGRIYRIIEDWDAAAIAYSQALEADPMLDYARCQLGMIYQMWGDYEEALNEYETIMIHNQSDSCAWSNHRALIRLMSHTGIPDTNASAAPREPSRADDLVALGYLYLEQGKKFSAAHTFYDALLLDPALDQVHCDLGLIYSDWGNHLGALGQYDRVQSHPCAEENRAITTAKIEAAYHAQASYFPKAVIPVQPSPADELVKLGYVYLEDNKVFSAAHTFIAALQIDPSLDTVRCELSQIYAHWGNYVSALNQLNLVNGHPCGAEQQAFIEEKLDRIYVPMTAQDYVHMAEAHIAKQEWDFAITDYQQALQLDPTRADVRCELDLLAYLDFQSSDNSMSHYEAIFANNNANCAMLKQHMSEQSIVDIDRMEAYSDQFLAQDVYEYPLPHESLSSNIEADTLYNITITMGAEALFYEAQNRHENGEVWLASALIDRYMDEHWATMCANKLRQLSNEYRERGYTVAANMIYLKAIVDSTC